MSSGADAFAAALEDFDTAAHECGEYWSDDKNARCNTAFAALLAAHAAAVADAEARGRAAALAEVDAACERMHGGRDVEFIAVDRQMNGGWYAENLMSSNRTIGRADTPTAAILAAAAALRAEPAP